MLGVLSALVVAAAALLLYFFLLSQRAPALPPPASFFSRSLLLANKGIDSHCFLQAREKHFWKCFHRNKNERARGETLSSSCFRRRQGEKKYKISFGKNNSPLFRITSNDIDKYAPIQLQRRQQPAYSTEHSHSRRGTTKIAERSSSSLSLTLQFFLLVRAVYLIQHYLAKRKKKLRALCDKEESESSPPIQSHYFSFSNTHTYTQHQQHP